MHILLETLFNTINSPEGDSEENCTTLKIVLKGLKELEEQNTAIVNKVLAKLSFNVSPASRKKSLPTLNSPRQSGETALILSAKNGYSRFVCILLEHGANPDLRASNGYTALLWSLYNNHRLCVQALLKAKANPNIPDNLGRTAIWQALFAEDEGYIQILLQHGAQLERPNNEGRTLLGEAIRRGKLGPLSLALAYGCLINKHHAELLQTYLYQKFLTTLYGLPTQNSSATLHQLEFCRGLLFEHQNEDEEADNCYRAATSFAPACRKRGDLLRKKGHFLMAATHYYQAAQAGDFFAPDRLAGLLERHENLSIDKIANPGYYLLSITYLRKAASLMPLTASLSSRKWRLLARHALGNEDLNPLARLQKTFSFLKAAETCARTAADKRQNKHLALSTQGIFSKMRENVQLPVDLIMDYGEQRSNQVREQLVEKFLECKR